MTADRHPINLDAATIRAEAVEGPYGTPEREAVAAATDQEILRAINAAVDDGFWHYFDAAKSGAIHALAARPGDFTG